MRSVCLYRPGILICFEHNWLINSERCVCVLAALSFITSLLIFVIYEFRKHMNIKIQSQTTQFCWLRVKGILFRTEWHLKIISYNRHKYERFIYPFNLNYLQNCWNWLHFGVLDYVLLYQGGNVDFSLRMGTVFYQHTINGNSIWYVVSQWVDVHRIEGLQDTFTHLNTR